MPGLPARSTLVGAAVVPAASIGSNLFSYALLLTAARLLSSSTYGVLSALLGVLLVATVPQLAMQTVTARRTAADGGTGGLPAATVFAGAGVGVVLLAVSPALQAFLHLDSILGIALIAASVPAMTTLGTLMGRAQGQRNFHRLAGLTALTTVGRSLGGLVGLVIGRGSSATLLGVSVGLGLVATAAAWPHLRRVDGALLRSPDPPWPLLHEAVHAAHAHIAFLIVTSLDVLLARHVLDSSDAGLYAVGSVVTRAALWLPQSVGLMLFPSMSVPERHRFAVRRAVAVVLGLGTVTVLGCVVLGHLVVALVGGAKYRHLDSIVWIFAVLGVCLALVQLAVLAGLARRRPRRVLILWVTGALDVGLVLALGSDATPFRVVVVLAAVSGAAAVGAVGLSLYGREAHVAPADKIGVAPGAT